MVGFANSAFVVPPKNERVAEWEVAQCVAVSAVCVPFAFPRARHMQCEQITGPSGLSLWDPGGKNLLLLLVSRISCMP
jgi:hypothetical protein